jgi:hypothetical protein
MLQLQLWRLCWRHSQANEEDSSEALSVLAQEPFLTESDDDQGESVDKTNAQPNAAAMQIMMAMPLTAHMQIGAYEGVLQSQSISVYVGKQAQFAQSFSFVYSPYAHPNSQFIKKS